MRNVDKQDIWETRQFLLDCAEQFPRAQVRDYVKHLYQSEFGGEHLISDGESSLAYLKEEIEHLTERQKKKPYFFPLCGHFCRINLSSSKVISPEMINRLFVVSSRYVQKAAWFALEEKLKLFLELSREDPSLFPFTAEEIEAYLKEYKERGYQPVHHSEEYRQAYEPAYRVIRREYQDYLPLYAAIENCLREKGSVNVAIDGNSGAGKTALANLLTTLFDCNVFHADDFFLPLEKRTPERLQEVGGNMDRERFREEICEPVREKKPFAYRPFDCSVMQLGEEIKVEPKQINIFEGSYSMHPDLQEYYDVKVFLSVSPAEQSNRILERNGGFMLRRFLEEWIPKENTYFEGMKIREACDLVFP
ncbi:MAG: hypothetical protein J1E06_10240 [Acutalibacter sp.]|nr:hypothetical protein [Acutalibacter sp.]